MPRKSEKERQFKPCPHRKRRSTCKICNAPRRKEFKNGRWTGKYINLLNGSIIDLQKEDQHEETTN